MTSWQSGTVISNGIRLHYTRTGGDKPPLLLAHGVTDDGLCWSPLAQVLCTEYDVIMADARGHGLSDAPPGGYDAATMAADLFGLSQALGLQRPLLLGHSMGAVTALALAGLSPQAPRAIVLEDPPPWWLPLPKDDPGAAQIVAAMNSWAAQLKTRTRAELIAAERSNHPHWSDAELGPWADAKLRFDLPAVQQALGQNRYAALDWPAVLPRITCPLLVITAEPERGALLSPQGLAALRGWAPHLQAAAIAGAGHSIRRDQFERYLAVVRSFLAACL